MKIKNIIPTIKNIIKIFSLLVSVSAIVYGGVMINGGVMIRDIEAPAIFPINEVKVKGDFLFMSKNEIQAIIEKSISGGFLAVDLNLVREKLEKEAWVKKVLLMRQWPDTIDVYVEERSPIAFWNDDGYIGIDGEVFKPAAIDGSLSLPMLKGPEGQHKSVWKLMNTLYKDMLLLRYTVTSLYLDERRAWQLEISANDEIAHASNEENINVKLGRFDTEKRLKRFLRVLPVLTSMKELSENKIKVIDMRYPNGFSVQKMTVEV